MLMMTITPLYISVIMTSCCQYLGVYVDNTLLWKIILNIYIKQKKVIKVCLYVIQIRIQT